MRTCLGCSQSLELSKYYYDKKNCRHAYRCMPCARKLVLRNYHKRKPVMISPDKKCCENCVFLDGTSCTKINDLPWVNKKRANDMQSEAYRKRSKRCFVKNESNQEMSA